MLCFVLVCSAVQCRDYFLNSLFCVLAQVETFKLAGLAQPLDGKKLEKIIKNPVYKYGLTSNVTDTNVLSQYKKWKKL